MTDTEHHIKRGRFNRSQVFGTEGPKGLIRQVLR